MIIDVLPNEVSIDGIEYAINSGFRYSMIFEMMMQETEIDDNQKIMQALELYYPIIPENINAAVEKLLWFYRCGKDIEEIKGSGKGKSINQIYSYDFDSEYIFSAFLDQYNVDLQDVENLHWFKFKAMFKALKEDNEIVKIMGYRSMDLSKITDKEQKTHYKEMQKLYKIPSIICKDEKEKLSSIENALLNGGDLSKVL